MYRATTNHNGIGDTPYPIPGSSGATHHKRGDLNSDGILSPADAVIALQIAVGSRPFEDAADVSGDGQVTSLDALMILKAAAGR